MSKHLKFVCVMVAFVAMFSSCKKSTDTSIIMAHKWVLSTAKATFSDSGSVSHNLMPVDTICQSSAYTEFHTNTANNPLKYAYVYSTTNCPGQITTPSVNLYSWTIDPDNTVLYLYGNTTDGTGGNWFNIQTLSNSSMIITTTHQNNIGNSGAPAFSPIYDTETDTYSYTVK